ncbi:glycosyl hydrolase 53 family protein [Limosilactobacillus balticus]|uniref:glycosyl hydrolase 53 family protein n=1 Tax=Limosilactobacillus balticus TaxID=2759747 RepID=UPI003995EC95
MEIKKHFKLYKDGKKWCCAAIATTALGIGLTIGSPSVLADADTITSTSEANNSLVKNDNTSDTNSNSESTFTDTNKNSTNEKVVNETKNIDSSQQINQEQTESNNSEEQTTPVNVKAENTDIKDSIPGKSTPNTFKEINGSTYYYGENGNLYRNQFYNNWGHTYYFQPDGARLDNGFYNNWGHTYYFQSDGSRLDNSFYNNWGHTYYFGADGARWDNRYMVKWGRAYYFGSDGVLLQNQLKSINGINYWINNEGVIPLKNQFLTANENQLFYFDGNGSLVVNKFYHNWGHTYYFGSDGARYTDQFLNRDGKVYYFDNQGIMYQDQYYKNWGHTYYFGSDGARYTDQFLNKNGKVYYFDNQGIMYQDQYYKNWGHTYYFGADGARYTDQFLTKDGHQYYFDKDGIMVTNQVRVINGKGYEFNGNGEATETSDMGQTRDTVAKEVAQALTNQGIKGIKYDWRNTNNDYQELALHDIAQEVAQGDTNPDKNVIEKKLQANNLLSGKVLVVYSTDFTNDDPQKITNTFMNSYDFTNADNSVLGVGADLNKNKLVIILFKSGEKAEQPQATSTISASISDTFKKAGVNVDVDNGLTKGSVVNSADLGNALTNGTAELLRGDKSTIISQEVLKAIFAAFAGNTSAVEGTKNYYNGNDAYHYEFWLEGQSADDKLNNFLALNKDAKYGDQLKVNYTATLVFGQETGTKANESKVPASERTDEQLDLAYKTGTDTGLRYDSVKVEKIPGMTDDMIRGVDVSSYQALINAGVKFYDFDGKEANLFKVLKDAGVNWVRLRLWNDPYNAEGLGYSGGTNDEASLVKMATDATKYGMKVLIDFHYSDFWADPAKQPLPKAWKNLSTDDLSNEIGLYTSKVLSDLKKAGANVQMVQVGNEVTNGAFGIWTDRDHGGNWATTWETADGAKVAKYLGIGAKAVRQTLPNAKIAIQLETPNIDKYRGIMTVLRDNNVDYDYLGTSYYPFWSTHDGNGWYDNVDLGYGASTPTNLEAIEKMAEREFGKKTVVLETGWINNVNDADGTGNSISASGEIQAYSHDPQGQVDALSDMYKALVNQNGVGAFYWEPAWIPVKAGYDNWDYNKKVSDVYGTGWASKYAVGYAPDSVMYWNNQPTWGGTTWDNVTLFDDQGYPLQSLNVYKGILEGYESPVMKSSVVTPAITKLWNTTDVTPNDGLTEGTKLSTDLFGTTQLSGNDGQLIGNAELTKLAGQLKDGISSKVYTAANGARYHYIYWLEGGNNKVNTFVSANKDAKYGQPLVANYSATVVVDSEPGTQVATSPLQIKISQVWNTVNNEEIKIDNPLKQGDLITDKSDDAFSSILNSKDIEEALTGEKGKEVSESTVNDVKGLLPKEVKGNKTYTTADGNQYYYDFWLASVETSNASYGEPVIVNYTASLKWLG